MRRTEPSLTRYCLPPVEMTAYMFDPSSGGRESPAEKGVKCTERRGYWQLRRPHPGQNLRRKALRAGLRRSSPDFAAAGGAIPGWLASIFEDFTAWRTQRSL